MNREHTTGAAGRSRRMRSVSWLGLLGLAGLLAWTPPARAQDEAAEFKAEVAPKETTMTLLQLIKAGGVTMLPLGLFSVAAIALIIRGYFVLQERKLLRPDLAAPLAALLAERDVLKAREVCQTDPTLMTSILLAGLDRISGDRVDIAAVREAMEEAGTEQVITHMTPISYLSIIGAVAPMLGLLGTVSGMIKAFQNISVGGMGKAELLAANIGEALITTAAGLIIAIPAMIFYFYFKNRFMRMMALASRTCGILLDALKTGQVPLAFAAAVPAAAPAEKAR